MSNLDDLINLQYEQLQHDELAHTDILSLSTKERVTHMTLHFAKYVGALFQNVDDQRLQQVLLDALIITLASANCLNVNLSERVKEMKSVRSYDELARAMNIDHHNVREALLRHLAIATGSMAKACEALDHQERGDWRARLEQETTQIACIVFSAAHVLKLNFADQIRARWRAVEKRSIFYSLQNGDRNESKNLVTFIKSGSR